MQATKVQVDASNPWVDYYEEEVKESGRNAGTHSGSCRGCEKARESQTTVPLGEWLVGGDPGRPAERPIASSTAGHGCTREHGFGAFERKFRRTAKIVAHHERAAFHSGREDHSKIYRERGRVPQGTRELHLHASRSGADL